MKLSKDESTDQSAIPQPDQHSALLLVDPQNDFFPGGAMGMPESTNCVQGSRGAQFHSDLVMPPGMMVISKWTNPKKDSTSGFDGSSLADRLEDLDVKAVFLLGPATQDCLKQTIEDTCTLGLQVVILKDALGISEGLLKESTQTGALQATTSDLGIS